MKAWLPRFEIYHGTTIGLDDDDFDGRYLCIQWGPVLLELFIGRRGE